MTLILCVDDMLGMLFNNRRQSKDKALRQNMLELTRDSKLWMNAYSASQFDEIADNICVHEAFLEKADPEDFCFVENADIAQYAHRVSSVILYRWNRIYPSDKQFPAELFKNRWYLENRTDFPGTSHETITREVYVL